MKKTPHPAPKQQQGQGPWLWRLLAALHLSSVLLCLLSAKCAIAADEIDPCQTVPTALAQKCSCAGDATRVECAGVTSDDLDSLEEGGESDFGGNLVVEMTITDSELPVLRFSGLAAAFPRLRALAAKRAGVEELEAGEEKMEELESLDLSSNRLRSLPPSALSPFPSLRRLDLSSNSLDEDLDPKALESLPASLEKLDISANEWSCSPRLAWMHGWSKAMIQKGALENIENTRCRYEGGGHHSGPLLLLAEYYSERVLPACPTSEGCTCSIIWLQEGNIGSSSSERIYSVRMECSDSNLDRFPPAPQHTREIDLSNNKLDDSSFSSLRVPSHHYGEVEALRLDGNGLETLPEKLLEMRLNRAFSARDNRLKTIPYDFSQRLMARTGSVELAGNPWVCVCGSQITDVNLIAKVKDSSDVRCGPGSTAGLIGERVASADPRVLCPPESTGETQELLMRLLCLLLALLIVAVLAKLATDYRAYRTRGQLPWIVLKMP